MLALVANQPRPSFTHNSNLVCHQIGNPMPLFDAWYQEAALNEQILNPSTVNLATVSETGQPSNRVVTMKEYDSEGFVFFTNPTSHKGQDLTKNRKASLCFFWEALNRQIRVEGLVSFISCEDADAYFSKQTRQQQVRAWISEQSKALDDLGQLKKEVLRLTIEFGDLYIPRPPSWSGYKIKPHLIEFMQREEHGLDTRDVFHLTANGSWTQSLLSP